MRNLTVIAVALGSIAWTTSAGAQVTQRVSVRGDGTVITGSGGSLSPDARYVVIGNGSGGVYIRDRQLGTTEEIFPPWSGNGYVVSNADHRYVAFSSANALVAGDTNGVADVFVLDRQLGLTVRASVTSAGLEAHGESSAPSITPDGRVVAFISRASDLVPGDTNGGVDVFVRDLVAGTTERVSVDASGVEGNRSCAYWPPVLSPDGRFVAFQSTSTNWVSSAVSPWGELYVKDRATGTLECVSLGQSGLPIGGDFRFSMTPDARSIAFHSIFGQQVYVRDRSSASTETIGVSSSEELAEVSCDRPSISADGRFVAFHSLAGNLAPDDVGPWQDVFLRDRVLGTTELASVSSAGVHGNSHSGEPNVSADGRYVLFQSEASNLVPDGQSGDLVVLYLRDRFGGPAFTSACEPGANGVIGCPCGNAPSGPGRGCDNSAGTGGAILSAAGGTYVTSDSLVFTTSGEKPTATSILLQGTSSPAAGAVYGQGVRCVGGTMKRLFTKSASGGSITAPRFASGDPTVSSRSSAKGNPIHSGESRWYLVFYRDPIVLGGCPSASTFNATQTGRVDWSP